MEKIASFTVDHTALLPGLYVSRKDVWGNTVVTTLDLRFTAPNREPVMDTGTMHTIEHLGATFLRNHARKAAVVYFGPMGCRTGFYLVLFGDRTAENEAELVTELCDFIADFTGEIPGAKPEECGNYSDQNLAEAKKRAAAYKQELVQYGRFAYPAPRA